jgi:acetyltransferase
VLSHETSVLLRWIAPTDAPRLRAAFHALSPESRYRRFLGHMTDLSPQMLHYLCDVDGWDHVAYVALLETPLDAADRLVGVARFIRARDEVDSAEVAITVADELHGHGLGTHLLDLLSRDATLRGIRRFTAYALRDNKAIRRVLAHLGPTTERDEDTVELKLASSP